MHEETTDMVKKALEVGYRHIDTAQIYRNEELVGKALKECNLKKRKYFITTKLWASKLTYEQAIKD